MLVLGIFWRVLSTARAFWIGQLASNTAAERAGNRPNRGAHQDTNRTRNHGTNGGTCSRTSHYATARQSGL